MSWPKLLVVIASIAAIAVFGFIQMDNTADYDRCLDKWEAMSDDTGLAPIICEEKVGR